MGLVSQFLGSLPFFFLMLLYWADTIVIELEGQFGYGQIQDYGLPPGLMEQFRLYDANADGYIDPYEFSYLEPILYQERTSREENYTIFQFQDEEKGVGKETVNIKAEMKPIEQSSMSKFKNGEMDYIFGSAEKVLPGLLHWTSVYEDSVVYGARNFKSFLPEKNDWSIGKPYYIIRDMNEYTPMNRYHPPTPSTDRSLLHSILAQFHPNIFLISRFGPKGTVGIVRAINDDVIDILFRVHAEFQLNSVPDYPFWFTPAQFSGRIIMNHDSEHIYYFELELPTDHLLNIDMEWIVGKGGNEVDIGYVPLMRAYSTQFNSNLDHTDHDKDLSNIIWNQEISLNEASQIIEKKMYPFKEAIAANSSLLKEGRYAKVVLDAYRFPVESMVLEIFSEDGSIVSQVNANNLLDSESHIIDSIIREDPINRNYMNFLKKGKLNY